MVYRALMVGWVLVLGAMCSGQEGQPASPPLLDFNTRMHALLHCATDKYDVDGQQIQFLAHSCHGSEKEPVFTGGSGIDLRTPSHGHVISARNGDRVDILWASQSVAPPAYSAASMSRTFPTLYWDQAERLLWVALIGTTNETKSRVVVWRLEVERDAISGALSVGSVTRMQQDFTHEPASFGPMFIDAARFTLEDDRLVLNLYHHDRPKTRIEPEGRMKQSDRSLEHSHLSQKARTTVQETIRAEDEVLRAPGPLLSLDQSTDTVEVDGHSARFVIHRVANKSSTASGSIIHGAWRGPGYAVAIVSTDESIKPESIWHARSPMMHFNNPSMAELVMADLAVIWWDEVEQCLWIVIGFGWSEGIPVLSVHRLELERKNGEGGWKVTDRRIATEQYSPEEPQRVVEGAAIKLLVRSIRFVRAHDGGVDLEIESSEGDTMTWDLPRKVREQPAVMQPPISELLVELIREDLAERKRDGK